MNIILILPPIISITSDTRADLDTVKKNYSIEYSIVPLEEGDVSRQLLKYFNSDENTGVVLYVQSLDLIAQLSSIPHTDKLVLVNEQYIDFSGLPSKQQFITERGEAVYKWAFRHLALIQHKRERVYYADHSDGFLDIWGADNAIARPAPPLVILLHGGFWRRPYTLDMMAPVAVALVNQGYIVANCEYRRVGGGGSPDTIFKDVIKAITFVCDLQAQYHFDQQKVVVMGHSAGGFLALKVHRLLNKKFTIDQSCLPKLYISLSGVIDIERAKELSIGDGAVTDLLQGEAKEKSIDLEKICEGGPHGQEIVFHGKHDSTVPVDISRRYVFSPQASTVSKYIELSHAKHMAFTDPTSRVWPDISREIAEWAKQ